jgi:hypothetical protein
MPPRWLTLAIIAFWLVMIALFNVAEVWPRFSPASEPLMFPVDVIDEAGQAKELANFNVTKNGTLKYKAEVEWHYHPEDDTFESECQLTARWNDPEAPRDEGPVLLPQVHEVSMVSSFYRLTRGGEMNSIDVHTDYQLVSGEGDRGGIKVQARVQGSPHAGQFVPHVKLSFPGLGEDHKIGPFTPRDFERDADPVPVLPRGTVLNPLHPPRRFPDLASGQRWRLTVIDPLALLGLAAPLDRGALIQAGIDAGASASVLEARVLPGLDGVDWDAGKGVPCRVIRCEGDGPVGPLTLWVRDKDGVVMRQDFRLWGDSWSFLRTSAAYKARFTPGPRVEP